jgi:hypothetical protein
LNNLDGGFKGHPAIFSQFFFRTDGMLAAKGNNPNRCVFCSHVVISLPIFYGSAEKVLLRRRAVLSSTDMPRCQSPRHSQR